MDYQRFYNTLFAPLQEELGPLDPDTLLPIMGFDGGGPLSFRTIGASSGDPFVTYVSCELAVRADQKPSLVGRYELLCNCDSLEWVRLILSELGRMSLKMELGPAHTVDIGPIVGPVASIQAVILEVECCASIEKTTYSVLRVVGITREELLYRQRHGADELLELLKANDVFNRTALSRKSIV